MSNRATTSPRPTEYPAHLAVMLTQAQYDRIERVAADRGVSKAAVVREALDEKLAYG